MIQTAWDIGNSNDSPDKTILLDLVREFGIELRKASSSGGGIYHSPCPGCGGEDRLTIWIGSGRYWCRQCDKKGDAIQFCRDFMGLSYYESCNKVGQMPSIGKKTHFKPVFQPRASQLPTTRWIERASEFIAHAHVKALRMPAALHLLRERGFTSETIHRFQLGWNPRDQFEDPAAWGVNSEGRKRIWLPKGLVIPTFFEDRPVKIKVRRVSNGSADRGPKYVEITGSLNAPSIYGTCDERIVILESEFDGILLQQCAGDLCTSLAIGGVKKKPDLATHKRLLQCKGLLFSLDFDQPGMRALKFWRELYPLMQIWPTPKGKSPGDAFKLGVDLHEWIHQSITNKRFI